MIGIAKLGMPARGVVRGGKVFKPSDILGLQLWLKADAGTYTDAAKTTPATADGDVIGAWADQSTNLNDAIEATTSEKPLLKLNIRNSKPVIRFDGTDDLLTFTTIALTNFTIYIAYRAVDLGAGEATIIASIDGDGTWGVFAGGIANGTKSGYGVKGTGPVTREALLEKANTFGIVCIQNTQMFRNGSEAIYNQTGNIASLNLGKIAQNIYTSYDFGGDIGEILIYNTVHDTATRQKIEQYLGSRWGVQCLGMSYSLPAIGPGLVLTWDDGAANMYPGFRYMQARGLKATQYVVSDLVATAGYLTVAQLQAMDAAGWIIGNHTKDHTLLTTLTEAQQEAEILDCATALVGWSLPNGAKHLAYPYGGHNADTITAMTNLSILTGRDTGVEAEVDPTTLDPWNFGYALAVGPTTTLVNMQNAVSTAVGHGLYCVLLIHQLSYGVAAAGGTTMIIFEAFIDWIVAQNIPMLSIADFYALM